MSFISAICLVIAMLLDKRYGDPAEIWSKIPHPVVLFGKWISLADRNLNAGTNRRWKGILFLGISCFLLGAIGLVSDFIYGGFIIDVLLAAILLAHKSLLDHLKEVVRELTISVSRGRLAVSKMVGRDVSELNTSEVSKAAVESAAEGFSDGVIAPCFWFLIFGLPGILIHKFVNTADSMVGYRNDNYSEFGWAAARVDDVLNWLPARITALLVLGAQNSFHLIKAVQADAPLHDSPNAGWPEAAMAYSLGIALGGGRTYEGKAFDLEYFNQNGRGVLEIGDINASMALIQKSHQVAVVIIVVIAIIHLIF